MDVTGALLAMALLAAACASPATVEAPTRWKDAGTPTASSAAERVTRYYVDETGTVWDDRGRKIEQKP
jgi:ABC-type glycerol-3-phosphate transport system substrate-binding protein